MGSSVMGPDYWCHRCLDTVNPRVGGVLICPRCADSFLELISDQNREQDRFAPGGRRLLGLFQSPDGGGLLARRRRRSISRDEDEDSEGGSGGGGGTRLVVVGRSAIMDFMHALGSGRASDDEDEDDERRARRERDRDRERDREGLNVTLVLQRRVRGGLEENLGILFESDGGGAALGLPRSLGGDYFVGPGLDLLIQRLSENDPNRYGTPPAAKTAVDSLPTVKISEEHVRSDFSQCVVCMEEFELGAETRQMPCRHLYHPDCILPWLKLHSSCPVCRFQLATEDHDDTSGKKNPSQNNTNNSSSSSSSDNSPQRAQHVSSSNDNGASSSNNNDNGASSSNNNDNGASSSVAPRGSASTSGGRSWWRSLFHPHSDNGDGPESGGS